MKCAIGYVPDPQTNSCVSPKPASPLNSGASGIDFRYLIFIVGAIVIARQLTRSGK